MADGVVVDCEPISYIEQYIGRRWSITVLVMLMILILAAMKETEIANTAVGFLGIIIGFFFRDIADSQKA